MSPHRFRPLTSGDAGEVMAFHDRCSETTQYLRFFAAKPHLQHHEAAYLCAVDQHERGAVVVTSLDDAREVHGIGSWDRVTEDVAEVAFVLEDSYQGRGIGRELVSDVLTKAHEAGYRTAIGDYLSANRRMRALLKRIGYPYADRPADCGVVAFTLDLDDRNATGCVGRAHTAINLNAAPRTGCAAMASGS